MCVTRERRFEVNATTPEASRTFAHAAVLATLRPHAWHLTDDIVLIVSELATETVLAGAKELRLTIDIHYDHLAVVMRDDRRPGWRKRIGSNETRRLLLDALTWTRNVIADAAGTRSTARVRCDPSLTERIPCELRPAQPAS